MKPGNGTTTWLEKSDVLLQIHGGRQACILCSDYLVDSLHNF